MKKFFVVLMMLLLCSCAQYDEESSKRELNAIFKRAEDRVNYRQNNETEYFSYYLPSDMTESAFESENAVFRYSNSRIVMNINIAGIIANEYYVSGIADDGFFEEKNLYFTSSGNYIDINGTYIDYIFDIYNQDDYFLLHLLSNKVNIYAYSLKGEEVQTARHMLLLAQGTTVNESRVLANYSSKDVVNHQRQQVDLFQYVIPKSGYLSDLVKDKENIETK